MLEGWTLPQVSNNNLEPLYFKTSINTTTNLNINEMYMYLLQMCTQDTPIFSLMYPNLG